MDDLPQDNRIADTEDAARGLLLVIEDDVGFVKLMSRTLWRELGLRVVSANTGAAGMELAAKHPGTLMLVDFGLPDISGDELMRKLREARTQNEFIVITGQGDEQVAVRMMKAGARDYLVKDGAFLERLPGTVQRVLNDVARDRQLKRQQELAADVLAILNRGNKPQQLMGDVLQAIKAGVKVDAIGIRLHENQDYPYLETSGFSDAFFAAGGRLCVHDEAEKYAGDGQENGVLECMCQKVIQRRTDPSQPFFSKRGSFWTNSITDLLASTTEREPRMCIRNRCLGEGFESVALIPLVAREETVGLLQLNDHRRDVFNRDLVEFLEGLSAAIGVALQRQQAAEVLRQREAFNRSLVENSPDCIKTLDLDGRLLFMSAGGQHALEIAHIEPYLNQDWTEFWQGVHHEAAVDAIAKARTGEASRFVGYSPTTKGGQRWWDVFVTPIFGMEGKPEQLLVVSRDVTEQHNAEQMRKNLEAQLRQSQKLEAVGTLAGGVAHEINNPITGIMNYAQLIKDDLDGREPTLNEFAGEIIHETERVAAIVKNLLHFARDKKEEHRPISVSGIVEGTLSLIRTVMRQDQIRLVNHVPDDLPKVTCRSQQIQQVIMNLLTNARDALNEKYPGCDDDKRIEIRAHAFQRDGRDWIRLVVEDCGMGIPEDVCEHMFEPFYTTKRPDRGTGLGLSISYGIVQDHGGALTVESQPGQWTRFHLDLPANADGPTGDPAADQLGATAKRECNELR